MSFGQSGILSFILIVIYRVSSLYRLIKMFQNNTLKIVRAIPFPLIKRLVTFLQFTVG